jgi:hypothetical protein
MTGMCDGKIKRKKLSKLRKLAAQVLRSHVHWIACTSALRDLYDIGSDAAQVALLALKHFQGL